MTGVCAHNPRGRWPRRVGGYTLVEMMLGMAVLSILMLAMASTVLLASRALPEGDGPLGDRFDADLVIDRLVMELTEARALTERSPTAVAMVLPDHDGDGLPERVRYAWSGIAGEPLTRRYNAQPAEEVLPGVQRLGLDYTTESATIEYPGPLQNAGEALVSSHDGSSGLASHDIDGGERAGQFILPELSDDIVAWRPTQLFIEAQEDGENQQQTLVEVREADAAGLPMARVLARATINEDDLGDNFVWHEVGLPDAELLDARQGVAVLLLYGGGGSGSMTLRYDSSASGGVGHRLHDTNGSPWHTHAGERLQHYLYGQTYRRGPSLSLTRDYLTRVTVTGAAEVDGTQEHRFDRSVALGNRPLIADAFWEADFEANPILLDANFDGQADWGVRDNLAFLEGTLSAGSWGANRTLETRPVHRFDRPVEVRLRLAAESPGDPGARFSIYLTQDSDEGGLVTVSVTHAGDGTQTLELLDRPSAGVDRVLVRMPRLPEGFIDARLILEPGGRTVALWVSGRHRGTFPYAIHMPSVVRQAAWLADSGGRGRFDYVSIDVGGTP